MTASEARHVADLERRLAESQATLAALLAGQIDAVVDAGGSAPILLSAAQAALRESEERLRLERDRAQRYLDTAEVMLISLDLEGRILLANRFACAVLEWPEGELLGRDWFETCVPPLARDRSRARVADVVAGRALVAENLIMRRSGEERLIEWRSTATRNEAGTVTSTLSSGTDITERSRAVELVRRAEERMRFALEASNVGIWDLDCVTGQVEWSAVLEAQNGLPPGGFAGRREAFVACIHPEDRAATIAAIDAAMTTGADFSETHRVVWPDGTVRWLSGDGRFLRGPDGALLRGIGISRDVTELRALDEQYRQAMKMEAVGRLASGVAHDFNNLLTVILGFTEFVTADAGLASQHANDLAEVIKAAQSASTLTRQLLAFSRQQVLHAAPLDLNQLLTEMTGMLGRLIGEDIEVQLALAPRISLVIADQSQLEQVVMNLVVNARDAMTGGGRLTVETKDCSLDRSFLDEERVEAGRYVMLGITDTGCGMSPETRRRLFEPFYTTKETGKGTGLGLSTTYGIIKQSGGHIEVESELGRGTTFKVYLPCPALELDRLDIAPAPAPALLKPAGETVLLVEDEAGVRFLARRILERSGYRVLEASNGDDAERLFDEYEQRIDLVVTDVVMPGCGGVELVGRLRRRVPALRVLYMSGYTEQSAAHEAGIDRGAPFVEKPFTAADFTRHVREALDA